MCFAVSWLCTHLISLCFDKFNCQLITKQNTISIIYKSIVSFLTPHHIFIYYLLHFFITLIITVQIKQEHSFLSLHWLSLSINKLLYFPLDTPQILQKSAPSFLSFLSLLSKPVLSPLADMDDDWDLYAVVRSCSAASTAGTVTGKSTLTTTPSQTRWDTPPIFSAIRVEENEHFVKFPDRSTWCWVWWLGCWRCGFTCMVEKSNSYSRWQIWRAYNTLEEKWRLFC